MEVKKRVVLLNTEVMNIDDFFRMIGKNEEEIKEEKKKFMEDLE